MNNIEIVFIPYLIYDGNKTKKLGKNKLTNYVISKKLNKIKTRVKEILFNSAGIKVKKYNFDISKKLIYTTVQIPPKSVFYSFMKNNENLKNYTKMGLKYLFGSSKHLIGNGAPDSWMSWDIDLIKKNEFNDKMYELGIACKTIKFTKEKIIKQRPSPSESATKYKIGTKRKGNNGKIWIVKQNKNGVKRWVLYK